MVFLLRLRLDCARQQLQVSVNGKASEVWPTMCPVLMVERLTMCTGDVRTWPPTGGQPQKWLPAELWRAWRAPARSGVLRGARTDWVRQESLARENNKPDAGWIVQRWAYFFFFPCGK